METLSNGCFYGSVLKRAGIAGFLFTETIYPPGLKIAKHSHEYPYFCYVRQGVFSETNSRRTRSCKPSTLIFHPPQDRHSNAFHHGVSHCFNIQIEHHWLDRAREQAVVLNEPFDFRGGLIASLVARLHHEFHHLDAVSSLAIEGLMLEVVAEAARQHVRHSPGKPPRWLEQAREVIHANFSESLTVAGVAEAVGVHPVHLARSFRRFITARSASTLDRSELNLLAPRCPILAIRLPR